jgi:hypothetical protein
VGALMSIVEFLEGLLQVAVKQYEYRKWWREFFEENTRVVRPAIIKTEIVELCPYPTPKFKFWKDDE